MARRRIPASDSETEGSVDFSVDLDPARSCRPAARGTWLSSVSGACGCDVPRNSYDDGENPHQSEEACSWTACTYAHSLGGAKLLEFARYSNLRIE